MSTGTKILLAVLGIVLVALLILLARYLFKKRQANQAGNNLAYTDAAIDQLDPQRGLTSVASVNDFNS